MAVKDSAQVAKKWSTNLGGATQAIKDGINSVTVAPGQLAAKAKDQYVAGVNASVDKWATNSARVDLPTWQQAALTKGVNRIAEGARQAEGKFGTFMAQVLPYIQSGVNALPARGGLEANIARSAQFIRHMSDFKRSA